MPGKVPDRQSARQALLAQEAKGAHSGMVSKPGLPDDWAMPAKKPPRPAPASLRKWRLSKSLTLEQVGNMIGVGGQTVHKWETGKTPVELETLKLLAKCYGTTPDALLYDPTEGELVERMRRAHSVLATLPAEKADQWLGVGEAMTPPKRGDD